METKVTNKRNSNIARTASPINNVYKFLMPRARSMIAMVREL